MHVTPEDVKDALEWIKAHLQNQYINDINDAVEQFNVNPHITSAKTSDQLVKRIITDICEDMLLQQRTRG